MKLKTAIDIAKDCGLETVGEAICNIEIHALSIFDYDKMNEEFKELYDDFKSSGLDKDSKIENKHKWLNL